MVIRTSIVLILSLFLLFSAIAPSWAASHYTVKATVLSGLNNPYVLGKDNLDRVYFVTDSIQNLYVWLPGTNTAYLLYSSPNGGITQLEYDGLGNIYFVEVVSNQTFIKKCLPTWVMGALVCPSVTTVFTASSSWSIIDFDVVPFFGTIYVALNTVSGPPYGAIIMKVSPSGTVSFVQTYFSLNPVTISAIEAGLFITFTPPPFPQLIISEKIAYILTSADNGTTSIYSIVGNNPPKLLISKPLQNSAAFAYIELPYTLSNKLYYVYREYNSTSGDSMLEVGMINNAFIGTPATLTLYSKIFTGKRIFFWFGSNDNMVGSYSSIGTTGGYEIFASLVFRQGSTFEYTLIRFYGSPMQEQFVESVSSNLEYLTFTVLMNGDLVYGMLGTGELIRAIR